MGEFRATQRRAQSPKVTRPNGQSGSAIQLQSMVDDRPWLMVGAAAGVGLVLGSQSRRSPALGVLFTSLAGLAARIATNAFTQWLEAQRQR